MRAMAMIDITLSLARPKDAPSLALMSRDLIEAGLGWEYRPERMSELIGARDTLTLVAHDAGRCVGFAVMAFCRGLKPEPNFDAGCGLAARISLI